MSRPAVGTAPAVPLQIRTVTVLGASGTMAPPRQDCSPPTGRRRSM